MTNLLQCWWYSYQFWIAVKQGNNHQAHSIYQKIIQAKIPLSPLAELYQKNIVLEQEILRYQESLARQARQINTITRSSHRVKLNLDFIDSICREFSLVTCDQNSLKCTGIDKKIFYDFEENLVLFLQKELDNIPTLKREEQLWQAREDLEKLKKGKDPDYNSLLMPYLYFMRYFLDNTYASYLAWFLIYQEKLLPTTLNILDLAAGSGSAIYGLALFLNSAKSFMPLPPFHICYYSLEKQNAFQYRGLQFWRRYVQERLTPLNIYMNFDTGDLFDYSHKEARIPDFFFDFIVVSHCFFYDRKQRLEAFRIYRKIFAEKIASKGHVLLVIQGSKLFEIYNEKPSNNSSLEIKMINLLLDDLNLKLVFYKYLTSTGSRKYHANFRKYAEENLPAQPYMSNLRKLYLKQQQNFHDFHYTLDDYVILAQPKMGH